MKINLFDSSLSTGNNILSYNNGNMNLTNSLYLSYTPAQLLHAVNKQYVDNALSVINAGAISSGTLPVGRLPAFTGGDVTSATGSNIFNLANSGVVIGDYSKAYVNAKGIITQGYSLSSVDIPNLDWAKITTGKPTTLAGYGITNAISSNGGTITGQLLINGTPVNSTDAVNRSYLVSVLNNDYNIKVGDIIEKPYSTTPPGFLKCNGAEISKITYSALYSVVGDTFNILASNSFISMPGAGQPWRNQYDINSLQSSDISGWVTGASLPTSVFWSQSIVTKNRVYLLGGYIGGDNSSTVYTAPINSDGTLGSWTTTSSLSQAVNQSQAIVTKNRVYLIGGFGSATVQTASINADGTLGTWTTTTSLPATVYNSHAIVTKNRVYLLGGYVNSSVSSTVYTAPINADGTLGAWTTGTPLPGTVAEARTAVTKGRVYLLGGNNGFGLSSTVYTAPINSDGTLGSWTTAASLPQSISNHQVVVTNNKVYLIGGFIAGGSTSSVYTSPVNADGTLGTWSSASPMTLALARSAVIITSSRIYVLGGYDGGALYNVVYAPFSGGLNDYTPYYDGSIQPGVTTTFNLPDFTTQDTAKKVYHYIKY